MRRFLGLSVVSILCVAPVGPARAEEPPVDEAAVRGLLDAKDLGALERAFAGAPRDEALTAVYRTRRLALRRAPGEEEQFMSSLPATPESLWRVYRLTDPSPSNLGEDPRVGDIVYGMFELAARIARKRGSGHRRVLELCLFSDGELAETAWEWCDWLLKRDPEKSLAALRTLPEEDQRRMCGGVTAKEISSREVWKKCGSGL
jgi:hypothetical protein